VPTILTLIELVCFIMSFELIIVTVFYIFSYFYVDYLVNFPFLHKL